MESGQHCGQEAGPTRQIDDQDSNAMDLKPAFQDTSALPLRAILNDIAYGIRDQGRKNEMGDSEAEAGPVKALARRRVARSVPIYEE